MSARGIANTVNHRCCAIVRAGGFELRRRVKFETPYWLAVGIWGTFSLLVSLALLVFLVYTIAHPAKGDSVRGASFLSGIAYGVRAIREAIKERQLRSPRRRRSPGGPIERSKHAYLPAAGAGRYEARMTHERVNLP